MLAIRTLLAQRHLALLLYTATLLLKVLVPTGYMVDSEHGRLSVIICSGVEQLTMTMEMPGMHGDMPDHGKSKDHGKTEMPCAFSGLSAPALGAADAVQIASLIAFVMGSGVVNLALPPPSKPAHLRPPLRGPPAYL